MLRWNLKRCLVGLAVVAALVIPSMFVTGAHGAQRSAHKYYPSLLEDWSISDPFKSQGGNTEYAIGLLYPGFVGSVYPSIAKNKDTIPAMWTKLFLAAGMTLMKSGSYVSHFRDIGYRGVFRHRIPKTNLRWSFVHGVPVWKVLNVNDGVLPGVNFWVAGQPGQCFTATAQGMHQKKVRRNGRRVRVWVPIPHAPIQHSQACLPGAPPPTTTTTG